MKKPIIIIVVIFLVVIAGLTFKATPDSPLFPLKSMFVDTTSETAGAALNTHVTAFADGLASIDVSGGLTAEQATDAKGQVISDLIAVNTELSKLQTNTITDAAKAPMKKALYQFNDAFADNRAAVVAIDSALGDSNSDQSLLSLIAQTQVIFKNFVVSVTGTGVILRDAINKADIDATAGLEIDDATGEVISTGSTTVGVDAGSE